MEGNKAMRTYFFFFSNRVCVYDGHAWPGISYVNQVDFHLTEICML